MDLPYLPTEMADMIRERNLMSQARIILDNAHSALTYKLWYDQFLKDLYSLRGVDDATMAYIRRHYLRFGPAQSVMLFNMQSEIELWHRQRKEGYSAMARAQLQTAGQENAANEVTVVRRAAMIGMVKRKEIMQRLKVMKSMEERVGRDHILKMLTHYQPNAEVLVDVSFEIIRHHYLAEVMSNANEVTSLQFSSFAVCSYIVWSQRWDAASIKVYNRDQLPHITIPLKGDRTRRLLAMCYESLRLIVYGNEWSQFGHDMHRRTLEYLSKLAYQGKSQDEESARSTVSSTLATMCSTPPDVRKNMWITHRVSVVWLFSQLTLVQLQRFRRMLDAMSEDLWRVGPYIEMYETHNVFKALVHAIISYTKKTKHDTHQSPSERRSAIGLLFDVAHLHISSDIKFFHKSLVRDANVMSRMLSFFPEPVQARYFNPSTLARANDYLDLYRVYGVNMGFDDDEEDASDYDSDADSVQEMANPHDVARYLIRGFYDADLVLSEKVSEEDGERQRELLMTAQWLKTECRRVPIVVHENEDHWTKWAENIEHRFPTAIPYLLAQQGSECPGQESMAELIAFLKNDK